MLAAAIDNTSAAPPAEHPVTLYVNCANAPGCPTLGKLASKPIPGMTVLSRRVLYSTRTFPRWNMVPTGKELFRDYGPSQ